ncbi:hypothetical protein GHT06_018467 [Daphnia sinensis]|uniref:Uncharacterized protein n=1 Tax=Daphnia sinensis TaxID=1820382 RepID=A0AAD5PUS7_9CRUS|nr:hypothetical protein GHT06_018467 [Daphnia sinensis]
MAPSTVVQLGLAIHAGGCPSIVMVNGLKASPLGSVEFAVEIAVMILATKAIVLDMKGIRLLLGNDTLKKFKRLEIQYGEGRPKLWLGELPVGLLEEGAHRVRDGASEKIIMREGRNLPPRSLVAVEIEPLSPGLACSVLIKPSASLEKAKGISAGRILVKRDEGVVRVLTLNPGNRSQHVRAGTITGNTVEIEREVVEIAEKVETERFKALADQKKKEEEDVEIESRNNRNSTPAEIEGFRGALNDFKDCFACSKEELGHYTAAEHIIPTEEGMLPI